MEKIKVGIIGVGKLGNFHCNALSQMESAELVGVHDVDALRAQEIAERYRCRAFAEPAELIRECDCVGVIVPTTHHLAMAKQVLQAGRPVFIEKPIAATLAEADEIVQLSESLGIPVQVGHIERFNPAIRALDGRLRDPLFIESHRLSPFDPRGTDIAVILDLMIHDIDIILSLVQSPVTEIRASGVAIVSDEADIANARIEFASGCAANVTASRISQRKMRKMRIFQKDAYISIDFLLKLTEIFRLSDEPAASDGINLGMIDKGKYKRNIVYEKPPVPEQDAMQAEWQSFFEAVRTGRTPVVTAKEARDALAVAMEIREKVMAGAARVIG
ncbi:MAG: Gfo/Idh/MocA family oxidoreductase [candidate division KSB1 bacterium]|nr:Gfo/Idh/MocA family oxidoreductase [candidate division KSB1 bacterium]